MGWFSRRREEREGAERRLADRVEHPRSYDPEAAGVWDIIASWPYPVDGVRMVSDVLLAQKIWQERQEGENN